MADKLQRLVMLDWDGVVAKPNENSFSILREAMMNTFQRNMGISPDKFDSLDWPAIFEQCKGVTERYYLDIVADACGIPSYEHNRLFQQFIGERSKLVQQYNHERGITHFDDLNIFSDFEPFIDLLKEDGKYDTLVFSVSGNPNYVMKDRMPDRISRLYDYWVGGEYGKTRGDMIKIALREAQQQYGFRGLMDESGAYVNAFYFDDAARAVTSAASEGVRTIWIPRQVPSELNKTLQRNYGVQVNNADLYYLRHLLLYDDFLEKFGPRETKNILVGDTENRVTQRVFVAPSLVDHHLIEHRVEGYYPGWMDPAMHMWGRIRWADSKERFMHDEGRFEGRRVGARHFSDYYDLYTGYLESRRRPGKERR